MSAAFKYYIHDTDKGYTLEMSGPFGEKSVAELNCCWQPAQTTLKNRSLTLDLRGLTSIDEHSRQWLATMAQDGARCLPESFLLDTVAGLDRNKMHAYQRSRQSVLGRLFRFAPKPSPKPAP